MPWENWPLPGARKLPPDKTRLSNQNYPIRIPGTWTSGLTSWSFPGEMPKYEIADEGGKLNLNQVSEEILLRLFTILGVPEIKARIMVDSILDWRTKDDQPRPYGAKNAYYLRLDPPYVARNGKFETVSELAWVRGF